MRFMVIHRMMWGYGLAPLLCQGCSHIPRSNRETVKMAGNLKVQSSVRVMMLCVLHSYTYIKCLCFPYLDDSSSNLGFAPGIFKRSRWVLQRGYRNGWDVMTQGTMDAIMLFMHFVFLYEFSNYVSVMLCYLSCSKLMLCFKVCWKLMLCAKICWEKLTSDNE